MRTRLVSILGLGPINSEAPHYETTVYRRDEVPSQPTPLVQTALAELYGAASTVIIASAKVRERWLDTGLFAQHFSGPCTVIDVPDGGGTEDRWELFRAFQRALSLDPIAAAGEDAPPQEILFDVTHGFRLQPMLGLAALDFTLAEWRRADLSPEQCPNVRVLYGAFEAKDAQGHAPIWDLSEVITAGAWNRAIDALLRYGRADDLEFLATTTSAAAIKEAQSRGIKGSALSSYSALKGLGKAARTFADDLALNRTPAILNNSAKGLLAQLQSESIAAWKQRLPVITQALDALVATVAPLQAEKMFSPEGMRAIRALAALQFRTQRFAALASTLGEALTTLYCAARGLPWGPEPEHREFQNERGFRDDITNTDSQLARTPDRIEDNLHRDLLTLISSLKQTRNDVAHAGYRSSASKAQDLRRLLNDYLNQFSAISDRVLTAQQPAPFLNFTNHPVSTWSDAQRDAALALALGNPADLPQGMPHVDPKCDGKAINEMAQELADAAKKQGVRGAAVQGEHSLSFALTAALHAHGVRVFVATSERLVEEEERHGAKVAVHHFNFQQWRELLPYHAPKNSDAD